MEKPSKKFFIIIACVALVIILWLLRLFAIPSEGGAKIFRSILYPVLFIFWGFTLRHRLVHPQVRRLAISIAGLMVFWFVLRSIKFGILDLNVKRYLWYLYYIPKILIVMMAVLMAFAKGMPDEKRLPRRYGIFWLISAVLILFVITNDLHQLVFAFPDNAAVWSDDDYSYGVGYYIVMAWVITCTMGTFVVLAIKCRHPENHKRILLTGIPMILLLGYWVLYIISVKWLMVLFGDMTAVVCVLDMAVLELCIGTGLMRSNTGYGELFKKCSLDVQLIDENDAILMSSENSLSLTARQIENAKNHPVLIDKNILLKCKTISIGSVLWQEDISEISGVIAQIEENNKNLAEQSRIEREKYEADKELLSLQEKNRAMDMLSRETAGQLNLIDSLFVQYAQEKNETLRDRLLAGVLVIGAYIKRYGNLLLAVEKNKLMDITDLNCCFEETFTNLELMGVKVLISLPSEEYIRTADMLRIYRTFEMALEKCLFGISHLWVNGRATAEQIIINIVFACDTDLSEFASEADEFLAEDKNFRFTFRIEKGGVKE